MTKGKAGAGASADDLAVLEQGTPYVRSILAFLIYLRLGRVDVPNDAREIDVCYDLADIFVQRLKRHVGGGE